MAQNSSLNSTPSAERTHIGFFGRTNAGKSSLVNAVTGQSLAIVSEVRGTTTDPVTKSMELLPLGPVVIIDTPGIDDDGGLGSLRVERAWRMLNKVDLGVLVIDALEGPSEEDLALLERMRKKAIPHLIAFTKCDLAGADGETQKKTANAASLDCPIMYVSARTGENISALKEAIAGLARVEGPEKHIIADLISPSDVIVLVTPIDASAPKGRLILPQVMTIRDILDALGCAMTVQTEELSGAIASLAKPPRAVVTDSQAFGPVSKTVPESVPLTSFSILMARYKGILDTAVKGARHLAKLRDGDRVLISEGCTHHRQCEDIGTVKLPGWISRFTGKQLEFAFTSGGEFPEDLSPYALIVHCGGCMLNEREMHYRMACAADAGVAFTNYGTLIAHMNGILDRSLSIFQ